MIDGRCKEMLKQFKVNCFIETGTDKGETVALVSRWLAEQSSEFGKIIDNVTTGARSYRLDSQPISYPIFADVKLAPYQIHSIDSDRYSYEQAKENFKSNFNISLHQGNSADVLKKLLTGNDRAGLPNEEILFFLDAHWGAYWPLRDELDIICQRSRYLIVIDDFWVPGRSDAAAPNGDFGYDVYQDQILNWAYIKDKFTNAPIRSFYPNTPNRDKRGWILITKGFSDDQLRFLRALDLFEVTAQDQRHAVNVKPSWRRYLNLKGIVKAALPVAWLRWGHRIYEKTVH